MGTGPRIRRRLSQLLASSLACLGVVGACAGCTSAGAAGDSRSARPAARWQLVKLPRSIARTWILNSVTCPTARFCMVVGSDRAGAAAATLTGSTWHVLRPVQRKSLGVPSEFMSVSCPSTTDCLAVGLTPPRSANEELRPLAEHWNGTRWSLQATAPLRPAGWSQTLPAVSCPSATTCMAAAKIGSDAAGTGADGAAEIWHLGEPRWRNGGLRGATWLLGVSCVSDVHCVAISYDAIYSWNDDRWTRQHIRGLRADAPSAISCASLTRCVVIAGSDPATSFVLHGRTWTRHKMPGLRGNNWTAFGGLSCPASSSCTAVGSVSAHNEDETPTVLAEQWNGTTWHIERVEPAPSGGYTSLSAVSCPTPAACLTVGRQGTDGLISLVERSS
jgi:hypothetical protein